MNRELIAVIDEIGRQKGIDKARVIGAIESALQTAAKKRFGQAENIQVEIDSKTGEISVVSKKIIVDTVANPKAEISLKEARQYDEGAEVGDEIGSLIEMDELGRIAAQTAKQVIFQKVREAEWEAVQKEYSTRQGDLVNGIILGMERRNFLVDLGKTEAILPIQEQIPRETYRRGDRVKALLLEVRRTPKDVQVILSRSHPQFSPDTSHHVVRRPPGLFTDVEHSVLKHRGPMGFCRSDHSHQLGIGTRGLSGHLFVGLVLMQPVQKRQHPVSPRAANIFHED